MSEPRSGTPLECPNCGGKRLYIYAKIERSSDASLMFDLAFKDTCDGDVVLSLERQNPMTYSELINSGIRCPDCFSTHELTHNVVKALLEKSIPAIKLEAAGYDMEKEDD